MKKIACVSPGVIVEGTVLKSGEISEKNRRDVTQECVIAMMQHLSCFKAFQDDGAAGYSWDVEDSDAKFQLVLYDTSKYTLALAEPVTAKAEQ